MIAPMWHCSVGFRLTDKSGAYCGYVGCAIPCISQEDGWEKGLAWLKWQGEERRKGGFDFLVHTFELRVRFF